MVASYFRPDPDNRLQRKRAANEGKKKEIAMSSWQLMSSDATLMVRFSAGDGPLTGILSYQGTVRRHPTHHDSSICRNLRVTGVERIAGLRRVGF
jgi:hypothetical protein